MFIKAIFITTCILSTVHSNSDKDLIKPTEWTGGSFEWPSCQIKSIFEASGNYIPKNIIATRAQLLKDEAILALPRYKPGVPVTLAKVSLKQRGCEADLIPFPSWEMQEEGNCKSLQSVVDVFVDANEILWVLDVGVVNTLATPVRRCPPKILGFSLKTGSVIKTVSFSGLVAPASRLQYLAVEYDQNGQPFAYVTDAATRCILVFDILADKGIRFVLPKELLEDVAKRDVLYAATVTKGCGNTFLLFTYLSSGHLYALRTDYLRAGSAEGRIVDVGEKPGKIVVLGTDLGAALFFRYEGQSEIYRWDSNVPFSSGNFVKVYKSPDGLLSTHVFPDLKRIRMRSLESNFPDFIQNTVGCGANQQISLMADFENCG